MTKVTSKIATPIILAGLFAIIVFIALDYEQLKPSFYIVLSLLFVYVFFFGIAIGQSLSSPVKKLLERATELSRGNSSSRVYLETKDELAQLADIFNKIAEELEAKRQQEEGIEKTLGVKVQARTKELEETINALEQKVKNRTIELERLIEETNKLREAVKSKGTEAFGLKKELGEFKEKLSKYSKPKHRIPKAPKASETPEQDLSVDGEGE
jgi:methyl-accepting chemotaxis protein